MALLIAWSVVLTLLTLANALFTFGVVRRLREHARLLARFSAPLDETIVIPRGRAIDDFVETTIDGATVTRTSFTPPTLVGFFSPNCSACTERLPGFVARAAAMPGGRDQVLAVVVGAAEETAHLRDQLAPVATVVAGMYGGGLVATFDVHGFPAFAVIDAEGTVIDSGFELDSLQGLDSVTVPVSS